MLTQRPHARFISALHRRLVLIRLAENLATAAASAALLAAPLLMACWCEDRPTAVVLLAAALLAAAVGLATALHRWPSRFTAAAEADHQLHLHDLLSTCLHLQGDDPFAAAVLADADRRCANLTPSQVLLRRYRVQTWGGMALAVAAAALLAALPSRSPTALAADASESLLTASPILPRTPAPAAATEDAPRSAHATPTEAASPLFPAAATDLSDKQTSAPQNDARHAVSNGATDSAGANSAAPDSSRSPSPPPLASPAAQAFPPSGSLPASGNGYESAHPGAPAPNTAALAASASVVPPAPASMGRSAAVRSAADDASSAIPDAYRDLTDAFFDRSASSNPSKRSR